jgi:hypothetical protein
MKKLNSYFLILILIAMSNQARSQALVRWLGLSGSTYKTEVVIPIQQVRYQGKDLHSRTQTYVQKADGTHSWSPLIRLDKGLVYSIFTEPKTGVPLIKVKPLVRFELPDGSTFKPTDNEPFPAGDATIKIADSQKEALLSRDYLFVPEGGKMPNFSQVLKHEWFVGGPFAAMVRRRSKVDAVDDLPEIKADFTSGVSLGIVTGTRHGLGGRHGRYYKLPVMIQFPLFMFGANTVEVKRMIDSNMDGRLDSHSEKESRVSATFATGIGLQIDKVAIMPLAGWDYLLGSNSRSWAHQGKLWFGVSAGVSLDKLIGLGK